MKAESSRVDAPRREDAAADERVGSAKWPVTAEAAQLLGVAYATFRKCEERGEIVGVEVNGVKRFDPAEIEELRVKRAGGSTEAGTAALLAQAVALVKASHAREERLFDQLLSPIEKHNERLLKRVDELEAKNSAMLEASEKALSLEHERKLAEHERRVSDARKDLVLGAGLRGLRTVGPALVKQWTGVDVPPAAEAPAPAPAPASSSSGDAPAEEDGADVEADMLAILEAIGNLSEMHLEALRATGAVTAEQFAALERMRAMKARETPADVADPRPT